MKFSDTELPSNRKFGLFFAAIFAIAAAYFFQVGTNALAWVLVGMALIFAVSAAVIPDILLPLNKLWMRFGLLLGIIVSPIVLGLIFFLLFTPIGMVMRIFGRDELRLRLREQKSYWKVREPGSSAAGSFENQF